MPYQFFSISQENAPCAFKRPRHPAQESSAGVFDDGVSLWRCGYAGMMPPQFGLAPDICVGEMT